MRLCLPFAWCTAALLVLAPGVAAADPPVKAPAPAAPAAPKALPKLPVTKPAAGAAAPVAAPAKAAAPHAKTAASAKKKKGAHDAPITGPIATYPGFRMLDGGGSRVFVTLSSKVTVTETKAEGKLTYRIAGVQVPTRTNRLPLLTAFFSTPVSRAELVEHDGGAELVIDIRDKATAQYRVVENDKGAELQVDFPKVATDDKEASSDAAAATPAAGRPATTKSLDSKTDTAY